MALSPRPLAGSTPIVSLAKGTTGDPPADSDSSCPVRSWLAAPLDCVEAPTSGLTTGESPLKAPLTAGQK